MNALNKMITRYGSQTSLGKKLGVTKQTVNSWAKGTKEVPPIRAVQMSRMSDGEFEIDDFIIIPPEKEVA